MTAPSFSVTIVYESREAGHRAKRFSDQLIAEAAVDGACELNLWNFGVLGIRGVRNAAASAAAVSDVVILSMSGTVPLPSRTVEWIEMWTWLIDGRKPVLVALFEARHPECAAIRAYLRRSAVSKKLDFFPIMSRAEPETKPDADFCRGPRPQADGAAGDRGRRPSLSLSKPRSPSNGASESEVGRPPL